MWKPFFLLVFLSSIIPTGFSQTIQIGKVREINSNRQPVADVQIIFEDAVPTNSDSDGNFRLVFAGKQAGELVFLNEIRKNGYELVNHKDFEILKLSNTTELGEDIILAKQGVIDLAKKEYYDVSDEALLTSFEKEKARLRDELRSAQLTQNNYLRQIKSLQEKYESQKESLDALAERFSRINFDDVSPRVSEAMQFFQGGKIDQAIAILENLNIEGRTQQVLKEGNRIERAQADLAAQKEALEKERMKQIDNIQLLMDMYLMKLEYQKVEALYDQMLLLDSTNALVLIAAADYYLSQFKFDKAEATYAKVFMIPSIYNQWDDYNLESDLVIEAYLRMGRLYYKTGNYAQAVASYEEAVFLAERKVSVLPSSSSFHIGLLIEGCSMLGDTYLALNKNESAKGHYEKAYQLGKQQYKTNTWNRTEYKSIFAYDNARMGYLYSVLKDYKTSLAYYKESYRLRKELYEDNPQSTHHCINFAMIQKEMGVANNLLHKKNTALIHFKEAFHLYEKLLQENPDDNSIKHKQVLVCERIIDLLFEMENSQEANSFLRKKYQLSKELNESYHQTVDYKAILTTSYDLSRAVLHSKEGIEKGIHYLEELIDQYSPEANTEKMNLIFYYQKLAEGYLLLNEKNNVDKRYELDTTEAFNTDKPTFTVIDDISSLITEEMKKAYHCYEKIIELEEELYQAGEKTIDNKKDLIYAYLELRYNHYYALLPNNASKILAYCERIVELREELWAKNPDDQELTLDLIGSYESLGEYYAYDRKKALEYYLIAEKMLLKLVNDNPQKTNYWQKINQLKKTMVQMHMGAYASQDFIEFYTQDNYSKDTLQIYETYTRVSDSLRIYKNKYINYNYKEELARSLNSQAWYGFFLQKFSDSEAAIREAMALNTGNEYLATNLAPALLLQGKFSEAKREYRKWKDQAFQEKTYRYAFLDDLVTFEKAGIIPIARQADVEAIRKILRK